MLWQRIEAANGGRDPERLALKYRKMASGPLAFFRGTAHLFYEDWPAAAPLNDAPLAWLCGDLHLENFGTYRADNRLTYFDCNDFDEGCLGPATWDVARLLTSVAVACGERGYRSSDTRALCRTVARAYAAALRTGKPRWVEEETATGIIGGLFAGLESRTPQRYLNARTVRVKRELRLNVENGKALPAMEKDRAAVRAFLAKRTAFRCLDIARRIAGNGSLGVPRFVILAEDRRGTPFLLDLKQAMPAAPLRTGTPPPQPPWKNDAERITGAQGLVLAMPPAFLQAVEFGGRGWVLRELLPSEDRVDVAAASNADFRDYAATLGEITAWGHLRASGRKGAANGDALVDCRVPVDPLVAFALAYARRVVTDWKEFLRAAPVQSASAKQSGSPKKK